MEQQSVRKTYKYKLHPTPAQEQALEIVVWRCRTLYNTALDERKTAWERCHVSVSYYQQKAELPDLKAAFFEYTAVHSQVLQDVLLRLDRVEFEAVLQSSNEFAVSIARTLAAQLQNSRLLDTQPIPAATIRAVSPFGVAILGSAPCSSSSFITVTSPDCAARRNGVAQSS